MKAGRRRRAATNSPESSESNWVTKIVETKWVFLSLFADIAANVYNKKSPVGNFYTTTTTTTKKKKKEPEKREGKKQAAAAAALLMGKEEWLKVFCLGCQESGGSFSRNAVAMAAGQLTFSIRGNCTNRYVTYLPPMHDHKQIG